MNKAYKLVAQFSGKSGIYLFSSVIGLFRVELHPTLRIECDSKILNPV